MSPAVKARACESYLFGYGVPCAAWMTVSAVHHYIAAMFIFGIMMLLAEWGWWNLRLSRKAIERERRLDGFRRLSGGNWP